MNYENIMLDVETLGTAPGCVILSIGACEFGEDGVGKMYYEMIDPESCVDWGLTIEPRTVMWWMDQNDEARKHLTQARKISISEALSKLITSFKWKGKKVWCNGASFDFPILSAGYKAVGMREPWEYWGQMDYRTLKNIVPPSVYESACVTATVKHDALADAVAQAETAIKLLKWLKGEA